MSEQSQAEVISFLSDGNNLPEGGPVRVIRTHGAVVFLSGTTAYKIKRDVRYDYLDFSTLQKRHDMLRRELDLNAPAAASIYRDVIAVTRDTDGQLHLGGTGEAVEWVLRMHRFDTEDELDKVALRGALDDGLAVKLGETIAEYHKGSHVRQTSPASSLIGAIIDELNTAFATMHDELGTDQVARYRAAMDRAFQENRAMLDARGQAGHVRRCHGDLHLRNIVVLEGVPTLFDALEFDETLGTCDVLYDLAFLLMDLRHNGLDRAANITLNSYLMQADCTEHYASLSLLPLFLSIRAAIRAMVGVQTMQVNPDDTTLLPEARDFLASALDYLARRPAHVVAIGGMSGTGKTVLAAALAPLIGAAPGAVHLRSDLERKALFHVPPTTPLPQSAYSTEVSAQIHEIMRKKAREALSGGHSVILDATWLSEAARGSLPRLATQSGARFDGIWLTAETEVLEARVTARQGDASDADAAVVRKQAQQTRTPTDWAEIDASGSPEDTVLRVQNHLFPSPAETSTGHNRRGEQQ